MLYNEGLYCKNSCLLFVAPNCTYAICGFRSYSD